MKCFKNICLNFGAIDGIQLKFNNEISKGKIVSVVGYYESDISTTLIFFFIRISILKYVDNFNDKV